MLEPLIDPHQNCLTALEVQGIANEFLLDHLPDRFTADQPTWQQGQWRVPVILAYPMIGSIGEVGEILLGQSGTVISHTPIPTIQQNGLNLYSARKDDIEAAFHKQETPYSCVPACLRMVLLAYGKDISEPALRTECDCIPFGTDALKAIDTARSLGFPNSHKATLTIAELAEILSDAVYPIVFLNLLPIDGVKVAHAMVLQDLDVTTVEVIAPRCGERKLSRTTFETAWAMMRNLTLIVL